MFWGMESAVVVVVVWVVESILKVACWIELNESFEDVLQRTVISPMVLGGEILLQMGDDGESFGGG